ncbi:hypothetical protein [Phenylobacterium sp.]|uniref:hypothetical protein n=1 Tax=Phenylobacterium sp. TaxID=1871053 RepID=UPI0025CF915B|nr:hypothetical protein [Phenylobacterium sp.]
MLQIELSALGGPELRRLLEVARGRKQHVLEAKLVAELALRPTRAPQWAPGRLQFERDPLPEDEPALLLSTPLRRRPGPAMGLLAAGAAMVAIGLGWGLSLPEIGGTGAAADVAPARMMVARAAPILAPPPKDEASAVVTTPFAATPFAATPFAATRAANPCLALPTAVERLVCGYPSIAAKDRQLIAAYDRAAQAVADPTTLERTQTAWRRAHANVSDRDLLAGAYDDRIRDLEIAAQARSAK